MTDKTIELKNISKLYPGVQALDAVDFEITKGEVHCLVGQNGSGKSTLIKILSGVVTAEPGAEIYINGSLIKHPNPKLSMEEGVQVIYQDLSLFSNLTVKENIGFRNNIRSNSPLVEWKGIKKTAEEALALIDVELDINAKVEELSIAQQQLVEIAKALTGELSLLILDEPTASLTKKEVNSLFKVIEGLRKKGISILFVSHKLNEIFEIAEKVTILRDGKKVGVYDSSELDHDKLVYLMTGTSESYELPKSLQRGAELILEARNLSKARNYKDISFSLKKGEILGITGLLGSGRTELALTLFGMNPQDSGELIYDGKEVKWHSNKEAVQAGIGYVPEDRMNHGLIMDQSIQDNLMITTIKRYLNRLGLIKEEECTKVLEKKVEELEIKIGMKEAPVKTLSGGNAQKVVLSKWLLVNPKVLILDEPTIGIDVIAKNSIHNLIKQLVEERGMSVIMISDEVQEVLNNCHRVLVMRNGMIVYEFRPEETTESELLENFNLA